MRWVKHMTATRQDEKVAAYLESCGPKYRHEGYGFYWCLIEIVASSIEKGSQKSSVTYPLTSWSRMLYCHHHTVGKYIGKLEVTHLVTCKWSEGNLTVDIPNLLKYRDEYSRKSGQDQETVGSKRQRQRQKQNTEAEGEKIPAELPLDPIRVQLEPARAGEPTHEDSYIIEFTAAICALGFNNPDNDANTAYTTSKIAEVCQQAGAVPKLGAFVAADMLKSVRFRGKPLEYLLGALRSELAPKGPNRKALSRVGVA